MNRDSFGEMVFSYMDYLGIPEMVVYYKEEDVAKTFGHVMSQCWSLGISPRMCAIIMWSFTMDKIARETKDIVKH